MKLRNVDGCRPMQPFRIRRRGRRRGCDLSGCRHSRVQGPVGLDVHGQPRTAGSQGSRATVGSGGRTAHVDASIGDILDNLDIAVMGLAEARYERFGVFTDLNYVQLSTSSDTPFGILASSVDFTTHSLMWTAAGEYRLLDQPDASIDAFAGFRLFSIKNELDFNPPGLLGGLELSQQETWADPIVGLKGRVSITPQLYLTSWALIGGGASSDIVWDVMGGAGYQFTDSILGRGRLSRRGRRLRE